MHNGAMTPKWLLPANAQTFPTQAGGVSLIVQENAYGEAYYRFAAQEPNPEPPAPLVSETPLLMESEVRG